MKIDFLREEALARPGSFSQYDMACIYPALEAMTENDVYLEVGVQYGRSLAFARKHSRGYIFGIDIEDLAEPMKGVNFINEPSNKAVKHWTIPINVLFIDGDHSAKGVKDDWKNFSKFVVKGGIVFFHDCDETSPPVVKLFDSIKGWKKGKSDNPRCSMAWAKKL